METTPSLILPLIPIGSTFYTPIPREEPRQQASTPIVKRRRKMKTQATPTFQGPTRRGSGVSGPTGGEVNLARAGSLSRIEAFLASSARAAGVFAARWWANLDRGCSKARPACGTSATAGPSVSLHSANSRGVGGASGVITGTRMPCEDGATD